MTTTIKDVTISIWLTWKFTFHNKSFLPDTYHQEFRDPKLWCSLLEILEVSGLDKSTNSEVASIVRILQAHGLELKQEYFVQAIETGNKDAIRDVLISLVLQFTDSKILESQVAEIVCEPPYQLPRSDLVGFVSSTAICNGKALCALVHSKAMVFNFHDATTKKSNTELISFVLDLAEKRLGIPRFFCAEDLINRSLDILPLALFVNGVIKHKGLSFGVPSLKPGSLTSLSVSAGSLALKKFQDQNLAAEIQKLKEQIQQVKKQNEQEIMATKATLTENLKSVEKTYLEETRTVKRKIDDVVSTRDADLKEARAQASSNQEELNKIANDKAQTKQKLADYENQLEDVQHSLQMAIDKKRRERAKNVESNIESTLDTVRNNYQDIRKKLRRIQDLKEELQDKSKSLEQQRSEYAMRSRELQGLTNFISNRINFLVGRLEYEKKSQSDIQQTMNLTELEMRNKSQEELRMLREQEEDLKRIMQRMNSEERKITAAEEHAEQLLFMENDFENEKTKGDDVEPDFDRADKEALESELEDYMARRQICLATLEIVKQEEAELDRSHKEVLSELDDLDREERTVKMQLASKPPQEKVKPEMGALVLIDDEISIVKMQEANLSYDMQELDSEIEHLKVERWNVKTHLGQIIAQLVILEKDLQVLRDMEIVPPSELKSMIADIVEKSEQISHEKSRLRQWRNYYFGKFKKTTSQLEASGKKDFLKEQMEQDKDEDMEDEEITATDNASVSSGNSFNDSSSSPSITRKKKRASWNFKSNTLQAPDEHRSRRKSITGALASLVPKLFS